MMLWGSQRYSRLLIFCTGLFLPTSLAAAPLPATYLAVSGNQIVDLAGNPVRLACAGYFQIDNIAEDIAGIKAAGFNCLRFRWYDATLSQNITTAKTVVKDAAAAGLKVILVQQGDETPSANNGWLPTTCNGLPFDSGPGTDGTDGCGDKGTITAARFTKDWQTVAGDFAGNTTVIGFDLNNEPHLNPWYWSSNPGGATWGTGAPTDLQQLDQTTGDAVQAKDPGALIIVEGIINFTDTLFNGAPNVIAGATDLTLAGTEPVQLTIPGHLVYSVHDYPLSISGDTPDSGSTKIQSLNASWGYLETQNIAPVWIGEMGASLDGVGPDSTGSSLADEQAWAATMLAYINGKDAAQGGPSFTAPQKAISTDWWAYGNLPGESPDGTLDDNWVPRAQQAAAYNQLQ